jgi:hypothetical protein
MNNRQKQQADVRRKLVDARKKIERAEADLSKAEQARDALLRDSDGVLSRVGAAEAAGISPGRVQQIVNAPWSHRVKFFGVLDERAEAALKAAGVKLRMGSSGGVGPRPEGAAAPPITKHNVYLVAESEVDALARVRKALEARGSFAGFEAEPISPSR